MTVRLDGELDGPRCSQLRELAQVAVGAGATDVRVDAARVTFAGSAAVRALVEARDVVVGGGGTFQVADPSPPLRRLLGVLGLEQLFAA